MLAASGAALLSGAAGAGAGAGGRGSVLVATVDHTITPVVADYVEDAVERAERDDFDAFVMVLDTPGGLDTSMRDIVQSLLNADVPTLVYVAPSGARAASAGAIITLASHVAAMAPGTNIGASTPVDLGGGEIGDKVINDAAAYAEAIAELRGRDTEFARNAVTEGASVTENVALDRGVVEFVADDLTGLLDEVDGVTAELADGRSVTLSTANASVVRHELGTFRSIQQWLADPNLAFLFMSLGTLAIVYELANPGVGAGGIAGAIMLILAFFSLSVLPVNVVGVLLLVLAAGLFISEIFVPGVGVLAGGGVVALILGGVFLFRGSVGIDAYVLWPVALVVGGTALLIARFAWRTRRAPRIAPGDVVLGQSATVRPSTGAQPQVFLEGAWWEVRRSDEGPLAAGDEVTVVGREGLHLVVEPPDRSDERAGSEPEPAEGETHE